MPLFKPIRSAADLPKPGPLTRTTEAQTIDFKSGGGYGPKAYAEMAKDVAAFANALGGVILIGTSKDADPLGYPGVDRDHAEKLSDAFAEAQAKHLSPRPIDVERLILEEGATRADLVLLVVNVAPYPDQLIGARVSKDVWRFPRRVGAHAVDLEPAMLPLYTANVRRNMILLHAIDREKDSVRICYRYPTNTTSAAPVYQEVRIEKIDAERNHFIVRPLINNGAGVGSRAAAIPLDDVDLVWSDGVDPSDRRWTIRVLGFFPGGAGPQDFLYHSNPRSLLT